MALDACEARSCVFSVLAQFAIALLNQANDAIRDVIEINHKSLHRPYYDALRALAQPTALVTARRNIVVTTWRPSE
jgi:hypothetical protein